MMRFILLVAAAAAVAACDRTPGRLGPGAGPELLLLDVDPEPVDKLDILFVIDNSGSMGEQQDALVEAARDQLFGQLEAELGGLPDLHIGVTSTSAPFPAGTPSIGGCTTSGASTGGVLTTNSCPDITGNFLIDEDDGAGGRTRNYQGALADNFACMGRLGTVGCGFEQPLAAMIRALDGSEPTNAGFLRDDAMLLVVVVADEDDCSTRDGALLDEPNAALESMLGPRTSFRCFDFAVTCAEDNRTFGPKTDCVLRDDSYLTPVGDLAARLRAVKSDPTRIMVAGIHGDADGLVVGPDPDDPSRPFLDNQCIGTDFEATPALRLNGFGAGFPSRWMLSADCTQTTSTKVQRIARATAGVLSRSACLLGQAPDLETCEASTVSPTGVRTALRRCTGGAAPDCVHIAADPQACSYTDHQLRAVVPPALVPQGHRLQVVCATR